ncbi:MAG: hypothetical protein IPM81_02570 [Saprospirales bacterium]|nr:hypothetical protein [Saprospirales bacterium]
MTIEKIKFAAAAHRLFRILVLIFGCNAVGIAQGSLQLSLSFAPPTCNGDTDGAASVAASGGISPYTYNWNNAQLTASIQNLAAGTYIVTVTDNAGTTAIGSVQVVAPAPLHFAVTVNMPSCNNSSGTMTVFATGGTSPYNTLWSNGTMGATAGNLQPGVPYTIQTVDTKGCQADTVVVLPEIDNLNVSLLIAKAECAGVEDGKATAIVDPPGGSYQYLWNIPGAITQQVSNLAPGAMVAVTVTDANSGCTGSASGIVGTHTQLNLQMDSSGNILCAHDFNGWASALASNGTAPYTYAWKGPGLVNASGSMITGLGAGAYGVTATDARGCTVAGGVNIGVTSKLKAGFTLAKSCIANQFFVKITDASSDPSSTIVAWNWTVTWDGGGAFSSSLQNPPQVPIPNQSAGIAQLVVTSAAGCRDTVLLPFKVDGLLDFQVITDGFSCAGGPVPVTVTGDSTFTYKWSPLDSLTFNPGPQQIIANPPGTQTYLLTVSSAMCFDVDSVTITRQPLLVLTTSPVVTCDTTALLTAATNVPATVVWTNLAGDTINPQAVTGGVYIAIATDSFQCVRKDTVSVTLLAVRAIANVPPIACPNIPFNLTAQNLNPADTVTYQWSSTPAGLTINNPGSANATASGPVGQYAISLTVTNQHSCSKNFEFQVNIQDSLDITPFIDIDQACNSTAVTLVNTSGYGGIWIFGDGSGTSTLDSVTYLYPGPGSYLVQFNSSAACVGPFEQMIVVTPDIFSVTAADVTACAASASLTAATSEPATVVWTDLAGAAVAPLGRWRGDVHRGGHFAGGAMCGPGHGGGNAAGFDRHQPGSDGGGGVQQHDDQLQQYKRLRGYLDIRRRDGDERSEQRDVHLCKFRDVHGDVHGECGLRETGRSVGDNFAGRFQRDGSGCDGLRRVGEPERDDERAGNGGVDGPCGIGSSKPLGSRRGDVHRGGDFAGGAMCGPGHGGGNASGFDRHQPGSDGDNSVQQHDDQLQQYERLRGHLGIRRWDGDERSEQRDVHVCKLWDVHGDVHGKCGLRETGRPNGDDLAGRFQRDGCGRDGLRGDGEPDGGDERAGDGSVDGPFGRGSSKPLGSWRGDVHSGGDFAGGAMCGPGHGGGNAAGFDRHQPGSDGDNSVQQHDDQLQQYERLRRHVGIRRRDGDERSEQRDVHVCKLWDVHGDVHGKCGLREACGSVGDNLAGRFQRDGCGRDGLRGIGEPERDGERAGNGGVDGPCGRGSSKPLGSRRGDVHSGGDFAGGAVHRPGHGGGNAAGFDRHQPGSDGDNGVQQHDDQLQQYKRLRGHLGIRRRDGDERAKQRDVYVCKLRDVHGDVHGKCGLRETGRPVGDNLAGRLQRDGSGRDGLRGVGEPERDDERAGNGGVDGPCGNGG